MRAAYRAHLIPLDLISLRVYPVEFLPTATIAAVKEHVQNKLLVSHSVT